MYAGSLHLAQRLLASAALLAPLPQAPLVTSLGALAIQLATALYLASPRLAGALPRRWARLALAGAYLALPRTDEVFATVTNCQWHLALLALAVLVARPPRGAAGRIADVLILGAASLSGPFAIALAPVAASRCWSHPERRSRRALAIVALGAAAQLAVLAATDAGRSAPVGASLGGFVRLVAGQLLVGTLLGRGGHAAFLALPDSARLAAGALAVAAAAALVAAAARRGPTALRALLAYAGLTLAMALAFPTTTWEALAAPDAAARYWMIPALAWLASLARVASSGGQRGLRALAAGLLLLFPLGAAREWRHPTPPDLGYRRAAAAFAGAPPGTRATFPLNPAGWSMTLEKR